MEGIAPHRRRQRRQLFAALACVLLSQWIALAHALAHAPGLSHGSVQPHEGVVESPAARLVHQLVAGHDSGTDTCRLLDTLAQDLLPATSAAAPLLQFHAEAVAEPRRQDAPRVAWRRYLARAPPVLS